MSTSFRLASAFFTALPGFVFFLLFVLSSSLGRDYWWRTYVAVIIILCLTSILFGFGLQPVVERLKMCRPWAWIFLQGLLAWTIALVVLGLLNLTTLCVGQNNGDGNNDFGMCIFMTGLSGIVYTPIYLSILAASSLIGHWVLSSKPQTQTRS